MSDLEEYREWSLAFVPEPPPDVSDYKLGYRRGVITSAEYADAAIAELEAHAEYDEATIERLGKLLKSAEVINNQQYDRAEQAIEARVTLTDRQPSPARRLRQN